MVLGLPGVQSDALASVNPGLTAPCGGKGGPPGPDQPAFAGQNGQERGRIGSFTKVAGSLRQTASAGSRNLLANGAPCGRLGYETTHLCPAPDGRRICGY